MTTTSHAGRRLIVALPVADVARSRSFFSGLGFVFDGSIPDDGTAAAIAVGEQATVMLLQRDTFAQYAKLPVGDPTRDTQATYTFTVASKEEVDTVTEAAFAAGGTEADGPEDHGFMYTRVFYDLDGHPWQVMWTATS
jgi:predicted lactoylglutathione lyase